MCNFITAMALKMQKMPRQLFLSISKPLFPDPHVVLNTVFADRQCRATLAGLTYVSILLHEPNKKKFKDRRDPNPSLHHASIRLEAG
jgi:hypothetical protein